MRTSRTLDVRAARVKPWLTPRPAASGAGTVQPGGHGCTVRNKRQAGRARLITMRCATCRRSEEHTSELQSLMRISYAVFCLKKKKQQNYPQHACEQRPHTK